MTENKPEKSGSRFAENLIALALTVFIAVAVAIALIILSSQGDWFKSI